jgi:hypothetical protein
MNINKYSSIVKGRRGTILTKHKSRGKKRNSSLIGTNIKTIKNTHIK